ncbi:MAG: hypothetical protein IKD00_03150 [Candidatus Methanomethylophilaceae archaeon]|nr:hypothetical protein [Candidatus Methanomethylophilaceae archaeon]
MTDEGLPHVGGDGMVKKYEFVSEKELKPAWDVCSSCLDVAKGITKRKGYPFECYPIGSFERKLVTREIGGNKGFDIDVDLVIDEPSNGGKGMGKEIFDIFFDAVRKSFKETEFSDPEDSTSVMTLKCKDPKNSRIIYSIDLAIMFYDDCGCAHVLHHYKDNGGYGFQKRFSDGVLDKEEWVEENIDHDVIADEYLRLKNRNRDPSKHSRSIYFETINNLYNECHEDDSTYVSLPFEEQRVVIPQPYCPYVSVWENR